jgi:branched-chain amino acid transport system ATP-binding protein
VAGYGAVPVLHGIDVRVDEGEIAVVLGANGVGKTTTLRAISGLLRPWQGHIRLRGENIERLSAEAVVRLGIGLVPEPPGVFLDMSVLDNLRVGAFGLGRVPRSQVDERIAKVFETFEPLAKREHQLGGSLSGGEQRMLAVARALMGDPTLLLVDEASMGLSPVMTSEVFDLLARVRSTGVTLCMVEQNVSALDIADRAFVIEQGRVVHTASGSALHKIRDEVTHAYLGTRGAA